MCLSISDVLLVLVEIENENLRRLLCDNFEWGFLAHCRSITVVECFAIEGHFALGDVNPCVATGGEVVRDLFPVAKLR